MRITNLSKVNIECMIDNISVDIQPGCNFEYLDAFEIITFAPSQRSYSILESRKSQILKLLSFFDDPFKLIREYHLSISSLFTRESVCNSCQLNITVEKCYADINARTYYDYVKVESNGIKLRPSSVKVLEQERIEKDFINNNSKLAKWQAIWDVILEPIVFEIVGYWAIYRVFSIWFGTDAWKVVLFLLIPNVLFEVLALLFKRKKYMKRVNNFISLFNSEMIFDCCYRGLFCKTGDGSVS